MILGQICLILLGWLFIPMDFYLLIFVTNAIRRLCDSAKGSVHKTILS
jgi:hypothetical protein